MTAGFVESRPIHVKPIAPVPQSATIPPNPSPVSKKRVSRALFGKPKPGSVEEEYRNEQHRQWERFNSQYIDVTVVASFTEASLPNLIERETREHQERLALTKQDDGDQVEDEEEKKCNSSCEKRRENAETTPQSHRSSNSSVTAATSQPSKSGSLSRNHSHDEHLGNQSIKGNAKRSAPYPCQKLITSCYTARRRPTSQQSQTVCQKHWTDPQEESSASGALLSTTESISSDIKQQNKT